jgi:hypothetical protein
LSNDIIKLNMDDTLNDGNNDGSETFYTMNRIFCIL